MSSLIQLGTAVVLLFIVVCARGDLPSSTSDEIRAQATRANHDREGFALPLASHWNTGGNPNAAGWRPQEQLRLIEQGHFLLPWLAHPPREPELKPKALDQFMAYYEQPLKKAAQLHLPLVLVCTQWESVLSAEPFVSLPAEQNPNVIDAEGKILRKVCPFGPVQPWIEAGAFWTANPQMRKLQEWYPDPPLVIFLSNNEHGKLRWHQVETSQRYLDKYGKGRDDAFKRQVVSDGWIERYRALQRGLRQGLDNPQWRKAARFVGYGAFGPEHLGRWAGWPEYALHIPGRISPFPLMWDGGSPSYYTHDWNASTDYTVWSPQIEFMNLVFMQKQAIALNPDFWLEFSVWDGDDGPPRPKRPPSKREVYRREGQTCDPARYQGFVQFGMWLLRPRAVREFRGWTYSSDSGMPYFMAIVAAVDRVHTNPTLREFWQKGQLVPNPAHKHPYQADIPAEYADADRWFLLDNDANPAGYPWQLSQTIPVFSLALVQGAAPNRRWLLYAHAPLGDRMSVKIALPQYRDVTIDVANAGSFYVIDEKTNGVNVVR